MIQEKYRTGFKNYPFKVYLGKCKDTGYKIYLNGFSWDCGWYYDGGYLSYYNVIGRPALQIHTHFDIVFLKKETKDKNGYKRTAVWHNLTDIVGDAKFNNNEWWRIKDLYKQFYILRNCAEIFQYGGHCTGYKRSKREIRPVMAYKINKHIENNIIREIKKALRVK